MGIRRWWLLSCFVVLLYGCRDAEPTAPIGRSGGTAASGQATTPKPTTPKPTPVDRADVEVTVHITGLCTFVDQAQRSAGAAPKALFLMNARAAHAGHKKHVPILLFRSVFKDKTPADRPVTTRNAFTYFELIGDEIRFADDVRTASPALEYDDAYPGTQCPTGAAQQSLYWIPRLGNTVLGANGKLKASDIDPKFLGVPDPAVIAAKLTIDFGSLEARLTNPIVWKFKSLSKPGERPAHIQQVAEEVLWKFKIKGDRLRVMSSLTTDLVTLKAVGGAIDFTIANVTPADVDGFIDPKPYPKEPVDRHFSRYYDFLLDKKIERFQPVAMGVCVADKDGHLIVDSDPCTMASYLTTKAPKGCKKTPGAVDGVNCGPDNLP